MNLISIIICCRNRLLNKELFLNIKDTAGCEYELIVIDNSENKYSIFQAYNKGFENSKGEYVIFLHDDVKFMTRNWGRILIELFQQNSRYGLFGVAGSRIKTKSPSGWWDCEEKYKILNIVQHFPNNSQKKEHFGFTNRIEKAAVIDGVFMAIRRNSGIRFDLKYRGFHGYDFNLCMEIRKKGLCVGVTDQILLEHFSIGNLNKEWLHVIIDLHEKYRNLLPINTISENSDNEEIYSLKRMIEKCVKLEEWRLLFYFWIKLWRLDPSSKKHFELIRFFKRKLSWK